MCWHPENGIEIYEAKIERIKKKNRQFYIVQDFNTSQLEINKTMQKLIPIQNT